jgi:methionine biosynthesis protein MetW
VSVSDVSTIASRYRRNLHRYGAHELILRQVPPGSSVLDVGCATGYLGEALVERGCRVWGIERDEDAAAVAASSYEEVHVVDLDLCDSLPVPEQFFDVVLCADVLEHLREPERGLRLVRPHLAPGGSIVVSLPNVAHLSVRLPLLLGRFEYGPSGILDRTHARLFTFRTARELVTSCGFDVNSELGASDRFGGLLHALGPLRRPLRGILTYNIVMVATAGSAR